MTGTRARKPKGANAPLVVCATALLVGCPAADPNRFQDSQGVTYERVDGHWTIDPGTPPALACESFTSPATEGSWMIAGDHVISICVLRASGVLDETNCRPVECDAQPCPTQPGFSFSCEAGLCVRPEIEWTGRDVMSVCLRDVPRFSDCLDMTAYFAYLGQASAAYDMYCAGGVCTSPTSCL